MRRIAAKASRRQRLNETPVTAPDLQDEFDHFFSCDGCGQNVDRRELGDLLHHQEPGHLPIPSRLGFIEPMLLTLADEPPGGDEWLHEIKYDGYRTQLVIEGSEVRAFTRNGYDWTEKYPAAVQAAGAAVGRRIG